MINIGLMNDHHLETWTRIECKPIHSAQDIKDWLDTYEGGKFAAGSATLWFEREHDALVFTLMWVK